MNSKPNEEATFRHSHAPGDFEELSGAQSTSTVQAISLAHLTPQLPSDCRSFVKLSSSPRSLRAPASESLKHYTPHGDQSVDSDQIELHLHIRFLNVTMVKTGSSIRMKFSTLAAVLLLSVGLPAALGAPYGWKDAHVTFYGGPNGAGTQAGACGYQNTYALGYGSMTAALSSPLFQGGAACGACYQIKCAPVRQTRTAKQWCYNLVRTITITATNLCPPGSTGGWCNPPRSHFDLPMPAFLTLARRQGGVAPVFYRKVRCAKRGGIRFTIGGNPWFLMILIHNVGGAGDIRSVRIRGGYSSWVPMYRNWGSLWTVRKKLSGALSFMITTSDGRTLTTSNCVGKNWRFGQTWEGTNYR